MVKYNYSELTENWYIDRSTTNRFALCDGMGVWCWGVGGGKGGGLIKFKEAFIVKYWHIMERTKGTDYYTSVGNYYTKCNLHV